VNYRINSKLIAEKHQIDHDFGLYHSYKIMEKMHFEYDFFYDYNDPDEIKRIRAGSNGNKSLIDDYSVKTGL